MSSKVLPFQKCQSWSGSVSLKFPISWSGSLTSARIAGVFQVGFVGFGEAHGAVKINGAEVGTFDLTGIGVGVAEGNFNIDITSYVVQGTNTVEIWVWTSWGLIGVTYVCVNDGTFTIEATGDVTIVPPITGFDWVPIAVAGGLVLGAIGIIAWVVKPRKRGK